VIFKGHTKAVRSWGLYFFCIAALNLLSVAGLITFIHMLKERVHARVCITAETFGMKYKFFAVYSV